MPASFSQFDKQVSEVPKCFAIWVNGARPRRATATTSSRNSLGDGFGMIGILPARPKPHRSGVNRTLGRPHVTARLQAEAGAAIERAIGD
jgi:hypothetical protein